MPPMTAMSTTMERLRELIRDELDDLVAIRHDLHAHPELAYLERRTSDVVRRELTNAGVDHKGRLAGGTGVLGHIGTAERGQTAIGLRADMDALPIQELNDFAHRSTIDGVMHACGHDGHTTILLGAARVLSRMAREEGLPRPVTFVFQPAEEGGAGAVKMIADGCLNGSVLGAPIAEMFGLHGWPRMPLGVVGTRPGPMLAAADSFDLTIKGQACHAAWPHVGRDPIVAAAAVVTAFQTIVSRNVSAHDPIVISATQVRAGTAYNIIPDEAFIGGTVRTLSPDVQRTAERRMREIAEGIAKAHGCEARFDFQKGYPPTVNDPQAVEVFREVAAESIGQDHVVHFDNPIMGGEDFAFYGQVVPACFFALGLIPKADPSMPELHQPKFDFNDDAIPLGVELFCRLALR